MAHYRTTLSSTAPVAAAFEHLADFATVADWDPGIPTAHLTSGATGQVGAEVSHDAELTLHGPARIMDIPLHLAFQVIGRRAEEGLRDELARLGAEADAQP